MLTITATDRRTGKPVAFVAVDASGAAYTDTGAGPERGFHGPFVTPAEFAQTLAVRLKYGELTLVNEPEVFERGELTGRDVALALPESYGPWRFEKRETPG